MTYFDHCATTPPYDEVIQAAADCMKRFYGNPSSLHRIGLEAEKMLDKAREVTAEALRVNKKSLIFTSGGTESNNLAVKGTAYQYRARGKHLITTVVEHPSVYNAFRELEQEGFEVTYLPVDATGAVRMQDLRQALRDETILVSIMHVNNETGRIQPIREIGEWLKDRPKTVFHVDAVQSIGKLELMAETWGVDLFSLSAHKIRGPKGTGLLYKREGITLLPLFAGGGQEKGLRPGTENVPLIVAMAKAVRMGMERRAEHERQLARLRSDLIAQLTEIPGLYLNGSTDSGDMAPHIVNFSIPGVRSEVMLHALEEKQLYVSAGSACSSGTPEPSRVLSAMGLDRVRAASGIRVSLSPAHRAADIERLASAVGESIKQFSLRKG